jgi:hypothetical protein
MGVVTAAIFYTLVVLIFAIEFGFITAWLVLGPAVSVAVYFIFTTALGVSRWLTVIIEVGAANIVFIFTTADILSIVS